MSVLLVAAATVAALTSGCSISSDSAVTITVFVPSTAAQPRTVAGIQTRLAASTSVAAGSRVASTTASTTASTRGKPGESRSGSVQSTRRPPRMKAGSLTIAFAGDVHFSGRTRTRLDDNPATAFGVAATALSGADLTMVNLETAITTGGEKQNKSFTFSAPPMALTALRQAGVDVATEANNHGADYGASGLADSLAAIKKSNFPVVGIGPDAARAYAPWTATVNGARVAILAASQVRDETLQNWTADDDSAGIASAYSPRLVAAVQAAKAAGNLVVVYVHWGTEYTACPDAAQRELADTLAAAGATAVVGTHAHVLQGAGWRKDGVYVAYGLSNYLWWRSFGNEQDDAGVLTLTFSGGKVSGSSFAAAHLDESGVPVPAAGATKVRIDAQWERDRQCAGLAATPTG